MRYRRCRICDCCAIDGECEADEDELPDECPEHRKKKRGVEDEIKDDIMREENEW